MTQRNYKKVSRTKSTRHSYKRPDIKQEVSPNRISNSISKRLGKLFRGRSNE